MNHNQDWHTVPLGCRRMVGCGAERLCVNDYSLFSRLSHHSCRIPHTLVHTHVQQRGLLGTPAHMHIHSHTHSNQLCKGSGPVTMHILCTQSSCHKRSQQYSAHIAAGSFGTYTVICDCSTRYYIREDRLSLALLADPFMEYRPLFDLYI